MTVGVTDCVPPFVDTGPVKEGSPLATQDVAPPVTVQVRTEESLAFMVVGLAVKVMIGAPPMTVTKVEAVVVPLLFVQDKP